ncbi:uncharacterized protein VNE69_05034 [Vairimorpha necatrix]|uniref:ISXO2-like transposase domain-containing protein n=1 Tax=Vairimorpha necatrix TaxID=6039 RepID=A0AAX4JBT6_9MICR
MKTILSISKKTINKIISEVSTNVAGNKKIGGPGVIVEIDESKFGKRKYNKGHKVDGVWVLGMAETLEDLIKEYVLPGSIIYTDCWKGYVNFKKIGIYEHYTVNHSIGFVNPTNGSAVKRVVPVRNRTVKDIRRFLNMFAFRKNNTNNPAEILLNKIFN